MYRNKQGRYARNYILYKLYFLGTMVVGIIGLTFIGTNQIANRLNELFQVENTQAEEVKPTVEERIYKVAEEYGISGYQLYRTMVCETGVRNIQSEIRNSKGPNGRENSWGYWQIYLTVHRDVTREEALDEDFAMRWAAKNFNNPNVTWYAYNRKTDKCN